MLSLVIVILVGLVLAMPAQADTVVLLWSPSAGATSYTIEQSVDQGATWTQVAAPPATACTGTPAQCSFSLTTAPSTGFALYRFSAVNAVGKTTRFGAGAWYCGSCSPPAQSANVGVQ